MTRKDYELIAGVIKSQRFDGAEGDGLEAVRIGEGNSRVYYLAHAMADALANTNPQFDRVRFITACGLSYEPK